MTAELHEFPGARGAATTPYPLPICIEAEQGVLGAILMHNEMLGALSSTLRPEHFGEEIHRRIYHVALDLFGQGKPITVGTLRVYLGDQDLGGMVTTTQYLARLAAEAIPALVVPGMAKEIRDVAGRRDLVMLGEGLAERARAAPPSTSCINLAGEALVDLQRLAENTVDADTRRDAGACAAGLIERARAIMRGEKRDAGVSTGLPDLDRATGGFQPGTFWLIGGRPRMGKTILATGFARKVASRGARDLAQGLPGFGSQIFSLEVTEDQIIARILADLAYSSRRRITFGQIMRGDVDESDLWEIEEAQRRLAVLPLALDVAPSLSVLEIAARVRSEKTRMAKGGIRLAVVFVDYMKFIRATDRYRGNRVYEVGEITKELKELAKAEGLCVVLLAQVNRAVDGRDRKDKAPGLADLRESGDLEADADVVLFVDRESVRVKQSAEYRAGDADATNRFLELEHKASLIVAKTRVGSETTLSIWFEAGASTFAAQDRGGVSL